jgi:hypothetical protein
VSEEEVIQVAGAQAFGTKARVSTSHEAKVEEFATISTTILLSTSSPTTQSILQSAICYLHSELAFNLIAAMSDAMSDVDAQWKEAFPEVERPQLYISDTEDEHGFLHINDSQNFSQDTTTMTTQQLHALSVNNQLALKQAQDEYLELESVIRRFTGKDQKKNPQAPQSSQEFEGRKEPALYGYKYVDNNPVTRNINGEDVSDLERREILHQDAFGQGGFFPTPKQYATKMAKASDKNNPDGWKPVEKDGKLLIPKVQGKHDEYKKHLPWTQEEIEAARADSDDNEATLVNGTPSKPVDKRLTRTRYDGQKVPPTRDVSEDPSRATSPRPGRTSTPRGLNIRQMTPQSFAEDGSPVPRKRQRLEINTTGAPSTGTTPASASQSRSRARAGQASVPTEPLSPRSMRNWKWTQDGLLAAIQKDYLWLHPDPVKALVNRDKLMAAQNPVRTWSMCNKWIDWHEKGLDKRPRNKDGPAKGADGQGIPKLGLAMAVSAWQGTEQGTGTPRPVSRTSDDPEQKSRKNSATKIESVEETLNGIKVPPKNSNAGSRKNSATSLDLPQERIKRTPSATSNKRRNSVGSIQPPSSIRSTRGAKRKYTEPNDSSDEETLQSQADRQLFQQTVEKEEKDGEFRPSSPQTVTYTPARRSLRGRSRAGGS